MNLNEQVSRIREMMGVISESQYFSKSLMVGETDDEVKMLQSILNIDKSGDFDNQTEDCVKEFQDFTNIKVDGIVGPETRLKLNDFIDNKIPEWKGCKKSDKPKTGIESLVLKNDSEEAQGPSKISGGDIVGSGWKSCKAWRASGGLAKWGDKIKLTKSSSGFLISYEGPSSGLSIAHAKGGGDTIHQAYNVLICELNPFLAQGGLKPELEGIKIEGGGSGKKSNLSIFVPLTKADGVYQIDRRGGWNHNPGPSKMANKCKDVNKGGKECIGPVMKLVQGPFGKITEYFITHQV